MGISSPVSRLAAYLVVGKALGVTWTKLRPREFVIVRPAIETVVACQIWRLHGFSLFANRLNTYIEFGLSGMLRPHRQACCPRFPLREPGLDAPDQYLMRREMSVAESESSFLLLLCDSVVEARAADVSRWRER